MGSEMCIRDRYRSGRETLFVHPKYIELLTGEENVWVYYAGVQTEQEQAAAAS